VLGCGGQSSPETTNTSKSSAITSQVLESDRYLCKTTGADPDGDGWGWENQNPCVADSPQPSVTADDDNLPIGILYFLWHCQATSMNRQYNINEVLNGQSEWGGQGTFHWWDRPAEGYYCLGDQPDLISRHLTMLRDAGIDFLVLDMTNHPNTESFNAETFI